MGIFARRPEEQLLLHCCSFASGAQKAAEQHREIVQLLSGAIDWSYFARLCEWHCMMPRAYSELRRRFASHLPREILERMGKEYSRNALRNQLLAKELVKLVQVLEGVGVPVIALKGPALAIEAFGDIALRQFGDLDLLIPESAFRAAVDALESEGYRPRRFRKSKKESERFVDLEDEFVNPESPALLDIHTSLVPSFIGQFLSYDELERSSRRVTLLGTEVQTLGPAELLLFLCVHGAKHGWRLLSWLCDIAGLLKLQRASVDSAHAIELAERLGYRRALLLGPALAARILDAPIPAELISAAHDDAVVRRLAAGISARIFQGLEHRPTLYQDWVVPLRLMEGSQARLRYAIGRALTPTVQDRELIDLGRHLYPLYLMVRPFRLLWEQSPRLLGRKVKPYTVSSAPRHYQR